MSNAYEKTEDKLNNWRVYGQSAQMAAGIRSGVPTTDPRVNDPEYRPLYEKLADLFDSNGVGFPRPEDLDPVALKVDEIPADSDILYFQTYYLPEHIGLALHVPFDAFETPAQIAAKAGIDEAEAAKLLSEMAHRCCIFHRKDDEGQDTYRHMGAFPGHVTMSMGRMSIEFWNEGVNPYMAGFIRPAMYDQDAPSWRIMPLSEEDVDGEMIDYDNAAHILRTARKVAVTPCICRAPSAKECCQVDPPYETCIAVNDFADFEVNVLKTARYLDKDEIEAHIQFCKDHSLAILTGGGKDPSIMCACCHDGCCGPFEYYENYAMGGPNHWKINNYMLTVDESKCKKCGECVDWCFSQQGRVWNKDHTAVELHPDSCVGCGVCVRRCPEGALRLKLKPEDQRYDYPEDAFDLFDRNGKMEDYGVVVKVKRGRGKK